MARAALTGSARDPFLEDLDRLADEAARMSGGLEDHCFDVAGSIVRLRFAGPALVGRMTRSLHHLRVPADATLAAPTARKVPALSIRIWDAHANRSPVPNGPWSLLGPPAKTVRGSLQHDDDASFFQRDEDSISVLDAPRDEAYHCVTRRGGDLAPVHGAAAPLSVLLRPWLAERDVQLVHAGAVGSTAGCVLLVGASGAGKSHAALACLCAGLGYIGDDTCLLGPDDRDPPTIFSLYSSAQPGAETLERLPSLAPTVGNPRRAAAEKAVSFLAEHVPQSLLQQAPLRAIAILQRGEHEHTRVSPASAADAVRAAAPASILLLPGAAQPTLERLARVARIVPCHHVGAGSDPNMLSSALAKLL